MKKLHIQFYLIQFKSIYKKKKNRMVKRPSVKENLMY